MKKGQILLATLMLIALILTGCNRALRSNNINESNHLPSKNTEEIATLVATTLTPELFQPTSAVLSDQETPLQPTPTSTIDSGQLSRQIDSAASDLDKFLDDLNSTDTLKDLK
jgi:hypothetical protein